MANSSTSPGYKKILEAGALLGRSQPCVLGYIKSGQLAGEKGADGHWYISDLSIDAFLQRRNLTSGARALTEVDAQNERLDVLEAKLEKLTAGMKIMLAHMKGTNPT